MKQNVYEVEKNVEKIYRGEATGFLTSSIRRLVENRLRKVNYETFMPFAEADKVILYVGAEPKVRLFRICCYKEQELKHSAIMGSLFGLNITSEMFGDIVKYQNNFYVYLLDNICELVKKEFRTAGNVSIKLEEVPIAFLNNFEREYESKELIVSSLRIDTIVSRLIGCNRDSVDAKVRDKEIFVNDIVVKKANSLLEIGDVFSIRRFGKFRFKDIVGKTKKDNFIIVIDKFV